jgi:hypothetical protein
MLMYYIALPRTKVFFVMEIFAIERLMYWDFIVGFTLEVYCKTY